MAELSNLADSAAPFDIAARGVGAFPNLARPRVIWIGLESAELISLAATVESAVQRCGFAPEPRPYSPHLTIGRVRTMRAWPAARDLLSSSATREFGISRIDSIALLRSELTPSGAIYHELARFALSAH